MNISLFISQIRGFSEKLGFQDDVTTAFRHSVDCVGLSANMMMRQNVTDLPMQFERKKRETARQWSEGFVEMNPIGGCSGAK